MAMLHNTVVCALLFCAVAAVRSHAIPPPSPGSTMIELYRLPVTEIDTARELQPAQVVQEPHSCYDVWRQSHRTVSASAMDAASINNEDIGDGSLGAVDEILALPVSRDPVPVPDTMILHQFPSHGAVLHRYGADEHSLDASTYHVRHLLMLLRMLHATPAPESLGPATYNATDAMPAVPFRVFLDNRELSVCAECRTTDRRQLRILYVPKRCRALLSDYECRYERVAQYLPHTVEQIRDCVDRWFTNLVRLHDYLDLDETIVNATALTNNCTVNIVNSLKRRNVACAPTAQQETSAATETPLAPDGASRLQPRFVEEFSSNEATKSPSNPITYKHDIVTFKPLNLVSVYLAKQQPNGPTVSSSVAFANAVAFNALEVLAIMSLVVLFA